MIKVYIVDRTPIRTCVTDDSEFDVHFESWYTIENFITPHNLLQYGDPSYATIASCLGILTQYNGGPAKAENNETKVGFLKIHTSDMS